MKRIMKYRSVISNAARVTIAALLVMLFSFTSLYIGLGSGVSSTYAATETVVSAFENSNVMDDLEGATIDGESIDLSEYNFDEKKNVQILSFIEFCYSFQSDNQSDYGLYIYVYNPRGYDWTKNVSLNQISLRVGGDSTAAFQKYSLQFLNMSEKAGYEGLFYKFKIVLTSSQKTAILSSLNSSGRVYEVSELELYDSGANATSYAVANTYTYTGYAEGYGSASATEDTLTCTSDGLLTLTLDVQSTYYRPEGSNGSEYKQDTLHSVYFSVPNKIIEEYGEMTAVHATWLNAQTTPIFVTGNNEYYSEFLNLVGKENPDTDYAFHTNASGAYIGGFYFTNYSHGYNYTASVDNVIEKLNYVFYAENGDADNYVLPAEDILKWFKSYTATFGGTLVNGKYSAELFESVDEQFTDLTITDEYNFKLTDVTPSPSLWQKIWGTSTSYTNTYEMSAIQKVTLDDMDNALSATTFCNNFFVAESDYDELYSYVKTAEAKDETAYLFRYYQSEYFAAEQSEGVFETGWYTQMVGDTSQLTYGRHYVEKDTNAYLAQMWVQLDFDIIDLTLKKDNVKTVIPALMSPMDIAADGTPPLKTSADGEDLIQKIIRLILIIVFVAFMVILFFPILKPILNAIGKGIVWIVNLPFRLIGKLFKRKD